MAIYKKKISVGAFLKKGDDYKDGDFLTIANEGEQIEGEFGMQNVFLMKLKDGKEGNVSFNQTSMNNIIDSYGEDSVKWIGREVKITAILSNVQGKMIKVYYFLSPQTILDEETGKFIIQKDADIEIPVIDEERENAGLA